MTRLGLRLPVLSVCLSTLAVLNVDSSDLPLRTPQETVARMAYVTVLDAANAPVTGLTTADVVILEDGVARQVSDVRSAPDPLAIALLVDTAQPQLGSIPPTRDLRTGLSTFVKIVQAASPESQIALMETGGAAVVTLNFTNKTQDLTRAVGRVVQSQRSSAVVLEALVDISNSISTQQTRRRAIVSLDFDSQETSRVREQDLSAAIQKAGAAVWAVSIRGSGAGASAAREAVLDAMTEVTGGLRLTAVSPAAIESQLRIVANALTSQYLVTYQRPSVATVTQVRAAAARGSKVLATRIIAK